MKKSQMKASQPMQTKEQKKQMKEVEARQEAIVISAREKILPILKKKNLSVDQSKLVCDLLAVAIQQGQYELIKKHTVSDLELLNYIAEDYPQSESVREILTAINDMNMLESINVLQWMVSKMNAVIDEENKLRKFKSLKLDF